MIITLKCDQVDGEQITITTTRIEKVVEFLGRVGSGGLWIMIESTSSQETLCLVKQLQK